MTTKLRFRRLRKMGRAISDKVRKLRANLSIARTMGKTSRGPLNENVIKRFHIVDYLTPLDREGPMIVPTEEVLISLTIDGQEQNLTIQEGGPVQFEPPNCGKTNPRSFIEVQTIDNDTVGVRIEIAGEEWHAVVTRGQKESVEVMGREIEIFIPFKKEALFNYSGCVGFKITPRGGETKETLGARTGIAVAFPMDGEIIPGYITATKIYNEGKTVVFRIEEEGQEPRTIDIQSREEGVKVVVGGTVYTVEVTSVTTPTNLLDFTVDREPGELSEALVAKIGVEAAKSLIKPAYDGTSGPAFPFIPSSYINSKRFKIASIFLRESVAILNVSIDGKTEELQLRSGSENAHDWKEEGTGIKPKIEVSWILDRLGTNQKTGACVKLYMGTSYKPFILEVGDKKEFEFEGRQISLEFKEVREHIFTPPQAPQPREPTKPNRD